MTDQATPQGEGPLTREQAVERIIAAETPQDNSPAEVQEAPPPAADEPEGQDQSEAATTAEDDAGEAAEPGDSDEEATQTAEVEPVDAPQWWDAEDKATFATLTPEQQAVIRKQEDKREAIVTKSKAEAAEARKQAESDIQGVRALSEKLADILPQAVETFKSKWDDVDWETWVDQDPQAALKGQLQMQAEKAKLEQIQQAKTEADQTARQHFLREEGVKLTELVPELAQPENLKALGNYLVGSGLPPEAILEAGAMELSIAHKAMMWDRAQANAKAKIGAAPPTKTPITPVKTVAPVAAATRATPHERDTQRLQNRFAQTGSREDAVKLIIAKGL